MTRTPKKHPVRDFIVLFALAAVCVGVAELSVARYEAPDVYESVVGPMRDAYHDTHTRFVAYLAEIEAEREERRRQEEERRRELERQKELERQRAAEELAAKLAAQEASAPTIREKLVFADPAITELKFEDGREILTGGNVSLVYYNQGDEQWGDQRFGSDSIRGYGCGPTALAMAIASLADDSADPANVAAWAARAGYCAPRSGSYLSIVQGVSEHYGLTCESLGAVDADTLYETLASGGVIVALMGPGHFTGRGHFILLHGVTLSGGILVADPNSRDNSLAVWEPQTIVDELSKSRHDGAPLWLVTMPLSL